MTRYAVLLRGINVGGIRMKMADLADAITALGYTDVRTVLASGNVLLDADDDADTVKERVEAALRERFGYEAWVHVLSVDAVRDVVAGYPFPRADDMQAYAVVVVDVDTRSALLAIPTAGRERVAEGDGVLYWTVPKGDTLGTQFGAAQSSARFKPWVTARNLNTLEKLLR